MKIHKKSKRTPNHNRHTYIHRHTKLIYTNKRLHGTIDIREQICIRI